MRKLSLALGALIAFAALFTSCKDTYVDPTSDTFAKDTTAISAYARAQKLSLTAADYGVRYVITQTNPTGKLPTQADELEFTYTTSKLDGTLVDVTARDTATHFIYGLGSINSSFSLLPGLEIVVAKMREGEKATILMPSYVAYGNQDALDGKLPANTPIRMDVSLIRSRSEDQQIENFIERNKYTVNDKQTTGLRIVRTTTVPAGAALIDGQVATVKYSGRTLRASKPFDSGTLELTLGRNTTVVGFEAGVKALRVGEKATIIFPSSIGYGSQYRLDATGKTVVILPYAPLAFDIEVVAAK